VHYAKSLFQTNGHGNKNNNNNNNNNSMVRPCCVLWPFHLEENDEDYLGRTTRHYDGGCFTISRVISICGLGKIPEPTRCCNSYQHHHHHHHHRELSVHCTVTNSNVLVVLLLGLQSVVCLTWIEEILSTTCFGNGFKLRKRCQWRCKNHVFHACV
jgi:hypothetical protein